MARNVARLYWLTVAVSCGVFAHASNADAWFAHMYPNNSDLGGGHDMWFEVEVPAIEADIRTIVFGEVATPVDSTPVYCDEFGSFCGFLAVHCYAIPPSEKPGTVNITVLFTDERYAPVVLPDAFTYLAAPRVDSASPLQRSIAEDLRPCTITGEGFLIGGILEVYFGDQKASAVKVNSLGTALSCVPPQFPAGSQFPMTVDLSVKYPDGGTGVLSAACEYTQIIPVLKDKRPYFLSPRPLGRRYGFHSDYFLPTGVVRAFFDDIPLTLSCRPGFCGDIGADTYGFFVPPHAPGWLDATIVNPDGGSDTFVDAVMYPYHKADTSRNGRIGLSEMVRVVQLYNAPGYHCDAAAEDGFALGGGDTSCQLHDTDFRLPNWKIDLTELLQAIQLFNSSGYVLCEEASLLCPASGED